MILCVVFDANSFFLSGVAIFYARVVDSVAIFYVTVVAVGVSIGVGSVVVGMLMLVLFLML